MAASSSSCFYRPEDFCGVSPNAQTFVREARLRSGHASPSMSENQIIATFDGSDKDRLNVVAPDGLPAEGIHVSVFYSPPLGQPDEAKSIHSIPLCLKFGYEEAKKELEDFGIRFWIDHQEHYCHGIFFYPCPIGDSKADKRARSDFRLKTLYPRLKKIMVLM